ncbi:MAG TPA: laccase domain-containing protein, partial [Burkholderiaceae bacterium]|nr:laccase domain-containing protein [Burkholderiaceae bacterium]
VELIAYLGPAIGPEHFEVGGEVLAAMETGLPEARRAFTARPHGKHLANLFELGRQALDQVGVTRIYGGHECTFSDSTRFFSFRRDRITGRHAALIWRV